MSDGIFIVPEDIKITMRNFYVKIKNTPTAITSLFAVFIAFALMVFSETAKSAASAAVYNCLNIVIPCIFPMLTISFFILETGLPVKLKHFTNKPLNILFGLSGNCTEAVFLGLTGGYNTAIKAAVRLKEDGAVTDEQAKRITLFFTNAGISFTVMLAGTSLTGSTVFGTRIYVVSILTNFITAYIYNLCNKNTNNCTITARHTKTAVAFTKAVSSSSTAIISICFSVILFAVLTQLINSLMPFSGINKLITITGEVTSAVIFSSRNLPSYVTAGIITFGGICIFIQNLPDLIKLKISPAQFISVRILNSIISFASEYLISIFFPVSQCTSVLYNGFAVRTGSISGSAALIFLCVVYLISVKNIKSTVFNDK